jgi:acetyl esterase/lipase
MRLTKWIVPVTLALGVTAFANEELSYEQTSNIVYAERDGIGLLMDAFAPSPSAGPGKGLGIACVTSGAWKSDRGILEAHRKFGFFDVLCRHGYIVFAIRPGSLTLFTAGQMADNTRTGIRHIKAHAADYAIDPDRLGLIGASAGGHLALLVATCAEPADPNAEDPLRRFSTEVRAVGVFCPATDFLDWNGKKYGLDLMQGQLVFRDGLSGKPEQQIENAARLISPVYQVRPGLPPFLLIHGDADSLVPIQQSEKFVDEVRKVDGSAELIVKQGGDHSWPTVREEIEQLAHWLDTQLSVHGVE